MASALLASVPLLCLAGAAVLGLVAVLGARRGRPVLSERAVSLLACAGPALAFALSIAASVRAASGPVEGPVVPWIALADFAGPIALRLDTLSATLLLVVTGIGTLIHVYSTGYMRGDRGYARYFACLNLFLFFMTGLVLAANLVTLFIGWEGVGLASYLLIGFWFDDETKARAGLKAFVVNRVGDAAFLLGIFLVFKTAGTVDFEGIRSALESRPELFRATFFGPFSVASAIGLLLFLGACGKSAQIPLHVWLPDAMAGPTPVSALIHAATMVTAGVYLVCRLSALYAAAPLTGAIVALVGAVTALFASTIALVQFDLKKVLAYSTVSQLGFLFVAAGVGAAGAAMFHLFTHAFFKAGLFLGAGSVIHALNHEQDIRRMGGLRWKMPVTGLTFLFCALALSAIPPFSGFFSKDAILWESLRRGGEIAPAFGLLLWALALAASVCTAFYAFRLVFLVFYGRPRCSEDAWQHCRESPRAMTSVLVVLAAGAALAGFLNVPESLVHGLDRFGRWVGPALAPEAAGEPENHAVELAIGIVSLLAALGGVGLATLLYAKRPDLAPALAARFPRLHRLLAEKYRVDEAYERFVTKPAWAIGDRVFFRLIDRRIIDGVTDGLAGAARGAGVILRLFQTGAVQTYVAILVLAAAAVLYAMWGGASPP